MDPLEVLLAQLEQLADLTPEQLAQLEADLQATAEELLGQDTTDDTLAGLQQIADAVEQVRTRAQELAAEAEERSAQATALADRIRGDDPDADDPDGDPIPAEEQETPPAEETPPPAETETPEAETPEAVAAAARPPRIGRVAARRPAAVAPRPAGRQFPADIAEWGLVAAANAPNVTAGSPIRTYDQLASAFLSAIDATKGYRQGPRVKVNIARAGSDDARSLYGDDRFLDDNLGANHRKISRVASPEAIVAAGGIQAITAAGGICAPTPVRYDLPIVGVDDRPVRDEMLVRFGADRGGVRVLPPPLVEDLDDAIGIWTETNDQNPSAPAVKPCLELTCPDDTEAFVAAITRCLQVGNFRARYFPEQVDAWMRLAAVNQARVAETRLLQQIAADSTAVTTGQILGTTRDVLAAIDRATAIIGSANRLARAQSYRFGAPAWLLNQIRTDLARELPGSTDERLAVADAQIEAFMRARNVTPTWFLDGEAGQVFGRQGDGPMMGWPSTVVTYLYPDGSHLFLDGGTLDLGIVRDSTLNSTNDLQMFAETFEGHVFHGVESWRIEMDVCPDGSTSATVDINPCTVGS